MRTQPTLANSFRTNLNSVVERLFLVGYPMTGTNPPYWRSCFPSPWGCQKSVFPPAKKFSFPPATPAEEQVRLVSSYPQLSRLRFIMIPNQPGGKPGRYMVPQNHTCLQPSGQGCQHVWAMLLQCFVFFVPSCLLNMFKTSEVIYLHCLSGHPSG